MSDTPAPQTGREAATARPAEQFMALPFRRTDSGAGKDDFLGENSIKSYSGLYWRGYIFGVYFEIHSIRILNLLGFSLLFDSDPRTISWFRAVQRDSKTREFTGSAGFFMSKEVQPDTVSFDKKCSNIYQTVEICRYTFGFDALF
jgi:hypothetical protein